MWQHVKEARARGGVGPARPPESGACRSHFTGQPLNRELTDRGARLVRAARTAPVYRLYVLAGTWPRKPGLVRVDGRAGRGFSVRRTRRRAPTTSRGTEAGAHTGRPGET